MENSNSSLSYLCFMCSAECNGRKALAAKSTKGTEKKELGMINSIYFVIYVTFVCFVAINTLRACWIRDYYGTIGELLQVFFRKEKISGVPRNG